MSKCNEQIQEIADYIDGELDAKLCAELEEHLKGCENCRLMVDSLKQTVMLCKDGKCVELPESISSRLNEAIKKRWEKKFGKTKS
jgi:RNA polymerase sigma-70 factor (ECF subfamily)